MAFLLCAGLLSAVYSTDVFGILSKREFVTINGDRVKFYLLDSDSKMYGRLVRTREAGPLSDGGLQGRYRPPRELGFLQLEAIQYLAYVEDDIPPFRFSTYRSAITAQGWFFLLYEGLPIDGRARYHLLHGTHAFFLAVVASVFVLAIARELGWFAAGLNLLAFTFSFWLVLAGDRLHLAVWSMLLPPVGAFVLLQRGASLRLFFCGVFALMGIKYLWSSFEYVTAVAIMAVAPLAYFAVRDAWPLRRAFHYALAGSLAVISGALLALGLLMAQIAAELGSWRAAVEHIFLRSLLRRTHGNVEGANSELPPDIIAERPREFGFVMQKYLDFPLYKIPGLGSVDFLFFSAIMIPLILLTGIPLRRKGPAPERRHFAGWLAFSMLGLLASMSWHIIFFQHSWIHFHMNSLLWQFGVLLPAIPLLGFCLAYLGDNCQRQLRAGVRQVRDRASSAHRQASDA